MLSEIAVETQNLNFFTALKKIKLLKNSDGYNSLSNIGKIRFLIWETMGIDNTNDYSEIPTSISELELYFKTNYINLDDNEKFSFNALKLMQSNFTNLKINEKIEVETDKYITSIDINNLLGKDNSTLALVAGYFLFFKGARLAKIEKWDESYNAIKKALDIYLQMKINFFINQAYTILSAYFIWKGEFEKALNVFEIQVSYFESIKEYKFLIMSYHQLAYVYDEKLTNLQKGLEALNKGIEYTSLIDNSSEGNLSVVYNILNFKAVILSKMGKYEESISFYKEIWHFAKEKEQFDSGNALAMWNINISELFHEMGELNSALEHIEACSKFLTDSKFYFIELLAENYYQFITVLIKLGSFDKAEKKFQLFTEFIADFNKHKPIESRNYYGYIRDINAKYKITQAMVFIIKKTMADNSKAQVLLQEIVSNSQTKNELLIRALTLLINLLFQEYKLFEKKEIIDKISEYSDKLNQLATAFNSIPLKIQILILQAKLAVTSGKLDQYESLMNTAKDLAVKYNLSEEEEMIENELTDFNKEITKWEAIISTPIRNRLAKIELEDYIKKMSILVDK